MTDDLSVRLKRTHNLFTGAVEFGVYKNNVLAGYVRRKAEKVWEAISLTGRVTGEYDTRANAATGVVQRHMGALSVPNAPTAPNARAYYTRDEVVAIVKGVVDVVLDNVRNGCTDADVHVILGAELESFRLAGKPATSWGVTL